MRPAARTAAATVVLAGPTAVAFFSGGYFDDARLWAGIVAWALVAVVALAGDEPLPGGRFGRIALAGLALLTVITGLSLLWAPNASLATDDLQRLLLYAAAFFVAAAVLRGPAVRAVEPALAGGAAIVIGYGLSERALPGVIHLARSYSAGGRLEQPLTYWNAMGILAAMGFVLCARILADASRPDPLRALAAAAAAPLGAGVYLTFSRGALVALGAGLVLLFFLVPTRAQLRAGAIALGAGATGAVVGAVLPAVRTLNGNAGSREHEGAVMLAVLVLAAAAAATLAVRAAHGERSGRLATTAFVLPPRRWLLAGVTVLVLAGSAAAIVTAERHPVQEHTFGATARRLGTLETNRYAYWGVALRSFAKHPFGGVGTGGFQTEWLRERTTADPATDAHSLYIETAAELGLAGLAALALVLVGVVGAARRALRLTPFAWAGPAAALFAWAVHAGLDWDWEMPAVSLVAIALAGALLAAGDGALQDQRRAGGVERSPARREPVAIEPVVTVGDER